jgi:hypothetical protein
LASNRDSNEEKFTAKFVFPEKAIGYMIGKKGYFIQNVNNYNSVSTKF